MTNPSLPPAARQIMKAVAEALRCGELSTVLRSLLLAADVMTDVQVENVLRASEGAKPLTNEQVAAALDAALAEFDQPTTNTES